MNFRWGRSWAQDKSCRAARSAVFRQNSKWWTKVHTRLTWVSRVKKVIQQFYWLITFFVFNWRKRFLAMLVTPQNCAKMFRNLTFVVQLAYFSIRPKKFLFFRATFTTKATFECFLTNFWATFLRNYRKLNFLENLKQLMESHNLGYTLVKIKTGYFPTQQTARHLTSQRG